VVTCIDIGDYVRKPIRRGQLHQVLAKTLSTFTKNEVVPAVSPVRRYRVLLCEDSIDNAFLIKEYLKDTTYLLEHAADGKIGVERFKREQFDIVLMDIQMPVMDGYAATQAIRHWELEHQRPPTPILALTAHAQPTEIARTVANGFTEFLSKPIRKAALLAAMAKQCAQEKSPPLSDETALRRAIQTRVPRYLASRAADLQEIQTALAADDFDKICRIGHNMKGSGSSFGFPAISAAGHAIEEAANLRDRDRIHLAYIDAKQALETALQFSESPQSGTGS